VHLAKKNLLLWIRKRLKSAEIEPLTVFQGVRSSRQNPLKVYSGAAIYFDTLFDDAVYHL